MTKAVRLTLGFLLVLLAGTVVLNQPLEASDESSVSGGLVYLVSDRPYRGATTQQDVVPFIGYEGKRAYIRGLRAGYTVGEHRGVAFDLFARARMDSFSAEDSDAFTDIDKRRRTAEAGISLKRRFGGFQLYLDGYHDILSRHGGFELNGSVSSRLPLPTGFLVPTATVSCRNDNLVDYYYGVHDSEASGSLSAYSPAGELNLGVSARWILRVKESGILQLQVGYERLGREIHNSPMVDQSETVSGMLILGVKL